MDTGRIWEVDFARGLAVIGMVAFNWAFALQYLGRAGFEVHSGSLFMLGRAVAFSFVFLAGLSMHLSVAREKTGAGKNQIREKITRKLLLRGLEIFLFGLLITLATFLYEPRAAVWFGVLHLIGVSLVLSIPLVASGRRDAVSIPAAFGILTILAGMFLSGLSYPSPYFLWLGLAPENFTTFDYFPLLPWYGVFLLGLAAGGKIYGRKIGGSTAPKPAGIMGLPKHVICFLGRHSLFIYLVHQPALLLALMVSGY